MLDWRTFNRARIYRALRLEKNAVIQLVQADGSVRTLSLAEQVVLDGVTAGTVTASKALVVDANKDLASLRNLTMSGNLKFSSTNAITAFATGGQASAVALTTDLNRITVCATAGDSVKLPTAAAGLDIVVVNDGAAAADIFPATGDVIATQAANIAVRLKPGGVAVFQCNVAGTWNATLPNLKFQSLAPSAPVAAQAETIFPTNAVTIVANSLRPGQKIRIRGQGSVPTANGTLQVRVRYGGVGGVLILDTGNAITPANGDQFQFDGEFTVVDIGAVGHIYGAFSWSIGTGGTATTRSNKTASIAIDTTADKVVNVTQQNGTGAGSLTLDYLSVSIES